MDKRHTSTRNRDYVLPFCVQHAEHALDALVEGNHPHQRLAFGTGALYSDSRQAKPR
jgi:hypothetical protein